MDTQQSVSSAFQTLLREIRQALGQAEYDAAEAKSQEACGLIEQLPAGEQAAARADLFELRGELRQFQYKYDEALVDFQTMLQIAPTRARQLEAEVLIASVLIVRGRYDEAIEKLGVIEAEARQIGALRAQALAWRGMGNVAWRRGNTDEALRCLPRALEMYRKMDDVESQMRVLRIMGNARIDRGEYDRAIKHHQECLNLALALKNKRLAAMELNNLGECYQAMYDMERALEYHTRSLTMRQELGIDPGPDVIRNLGVDLIELGRYDEGMTRLHEAVERARAQGNVDFTMQALNSLGRAYLAMNQPAQAATVGQELLKMADEVGGAGVHRAQALLIMGRAELAQQRTQEAHAHLQNGLFAAQASRSVGALLWELHAALGEASSSPMLAEVHFRIASDLIMQTAAAIEENGELRSRFLNHPNIRKILNRTRAVN